MRGAKTVKVKIDRDLYDRVRKIADLAGYATPEEFVAHVLEKELGHPVQVLVWPYGEHNQMAEALARESGFAATLNPGWRDVSAQDLKAGRLPRVMVVRTMDFSRDDNPWLHEPHSAVRAAQTGFLRYYAAALVVGMLGVTTWFLFQS